MIGDAEEAPSEAAPAIDGRLQRLLEPLEQLIVASVGLTSVALTGAAPGDLTLQQWRALVVLGRDGPIRVGDVAARVGMSLPSGSRLVSRLEERGYVATARDPRDRRGTIVTLSERGMEVRSAVIERRRLLVLASLGELGEVTGRDLEDGLEALAEAFARYA